MNVHRGRRGTWREVAKPTNQRRYVVCVQAATAATDLPRVGVNSEFTTSRTFFPHDVLRPLSSPRRTTAVAVPRTKPASRDDVDTAVGAVGETSPGRRVKADDSNDVVEANRTTRVVMILVLSRRRGRAMP